MIVRFEKKKEKGKAVVVLMACIRVWSLYNNYMYQNWHSTIIILSIQTKIIKYKQKKH